jgi:hypothetical protein
MRLIFAFIVAMIAMFALAALVARAAEAPASESDAAQYEADLNKRADGVLAELKLDDAEKAARVKQAVIAQYRGIKDIDDKSVAGVAKDDKERLKKAKDDAATAKKPLHDQFLATLSKDLTPEQVEIVKDKMTYNVVKVTYNGFQDMLPDLTSAQKAYILDQLKQAREIAMDQGSSKEKHEVFGKYKGRINGYLSKEGYDLKKASKDWAERVKARKASTTTQAAK